MSLIFSSKMDNVVNDDATRVPGCSSTWHNVLWTCPHGKYSDGDAQCKAIVLTDDTNFIHAPYGQIKQIIRSSKFKVSLTRMTVPMESYAPLYPSYDGHT